VNTLPTERVLALRRQITNLREMIAAAQKDTHAKPTYIQELKKRLRAAEKKLLG
jgi:hypothetical protein